MPTIETVIHQTDRWVKEVVIGCNFCPFALQVVKEKKLKYVVLETNSSDEIAEQLLTECTYLDKHAETETTLLILPNTFSSFISYLSFIDRAEKLLRKKKYEGIYQLASFHPLYCFAGSNEQDAANYTNRSPYPMLHLLREESIEHALRNFPSPENIPERNIRVANEKGLAVMQSLLNSCLG
ncbi:MAG: DUF1415 domain-containing protein [Bacteroidetes bacterium]|nr:DUF1415 domain-containing protein [Bacteroidota bacterium]